MKELSLVIPVMNEEENIRPLLDAVRQALAGIDYEIVLVDDGSTDGTKKEFWKMPTNAPVSWNCVKITAKVRP